MKAVVSISNPFDLMATQVKMRKTHYGIYDIVCANSMKRAFKNYIFKDQDLKTIKDEWLNSKLSIVKVDDVTRTKAWGYSSTHHLYRHLSCGHFLPYIDKPFLVLFSNDDPIVLKEHIPKLDLLQNKNCLYVESDYGSHVDFFTEGYKEQKYKRFFPILIYKYLDSISKYDV